MKFSINLAFISAYFNNSIDLNINIATIKIENVKTNTTNHLIDRIFCQQEMLY